MSDLRTSVSRCRYAAAIVACGLLWLFPAAAQAAFGFQDFKNELIDQGEVAVTQAGAHPWAVKTSFALNEGAGELPDGDVKDVEAALPPGLVGNASATPKCTAAQFNTPNDNIFLSGASCPDDSQVGVGVVRTTAGPLGITLGIYNLIPPPGVPAEFGFNVAGIPIILTPSVRTGGDYGVSVNVKNNNQGQLVYGVTTTLWGVPADHSHDEFRGECLGFLGFSNCTPESGRPPIPSHANPAPFLTLPTSCPGQPLTTTIHADSWQEPGALNADGTPDLSDPRWKTTTPSQSPPLIGCNRLDFSPKISIAPESDSASSPTGLAVDLELPALEGPGGLAESNLRKAVVTLPQGMTVNPPSADGLGACSPEQIQIHSAAAPDCPNASKVGSVRIETPLLENPLEGSVYLAQQGSNPFNSLLALYVVAEADGVLIKLAGEVKADGQTGQLTATFDNNPQQPFTNLKLNFFGGPRASLTTPSSCGTYVSHATLYPWSGTSPVHSEPSFTIDRKCGEATRFTPAIDAGVTNPVAGSSAPFTFKLTREDGQPNVSQVDATLPPGELAKLAGITLCPDALASAASCSSASQIGTTTVAAGDGSNPLYIPQPGKSPTAIYLAGAYRGAPYSIVFRVPAQAGPFDLGTVAVRAGVYVDPGTTQVTVKSDPLPQILQGIPITYRTIYVNVDREDFMRNPTNCSSRAVNATITSVGGMVATPSSPFQVTNCAALSFKPTLALRFSGATKRSGNPALTAVLRAPKGEANIAKTAVILPHTELIDNEHISNPCTRVQFNAGACPKSSILGSATAYTPLLDRPLTGPVYFRSNGGERDLPDLVVDLNGQIHVTLVGFIDSVVKKGTESSRVRTRFQSVPDAPVSKFVLKLKGDKEGLLENSVNLCRGAGKATVRFDGQNGKVNDFDLALGTSCGKAKSARAARPPDS